MNYAGFIGGSYQSLAATADSEHLINWYVSKMESEGATSRAALLPTPGVQFLEESTRGGVGRGHYAVNGREFAVIGTQFLEIDQTGAITFRGTVALDSNPATICGNGDSGGEIFVTSGGNGYLFTLATNVFAAIPFLAGIATMGDMVDDRFLCLDASTSKVYISGILDGATWSGSLFFHRSLAPDRWVGMKVLGRTIWMLGEQTSEPWYNVGTSPVPFAPFNATVVQYGCAAPFSASVSGSNLCWLSRAKDGGLSAVSVSGYSPEVVSTVPLAEAWGLYGDISDAVGDSYSEFGHTFYLLTFVTQGITWAYDLTSESWAQRGTWIEEDGAYQPWLPRWHAFAYGEHRILRSDGSQVYTMSSSLPYDVDGRVIRRLRRAPTLMLENKRLFFSAFELDLEPGLGNAVAPGDDPQVMMRMSNDGGKTWSQERWRSAGKTGEYGRRVRWNRCGMGRRRVFEVVVTDPVPWRVTAAYLEMVALPQQGAA